MKRTVDFLIIGAQKAGTTSLFEYLRLHPGLLLPPGKERAFFSDDRRYARGWDEWCGKTFAHAPEEKLWGAAEPQYMAGAPFDRPSNGHPLGADAEDEQTVPRRIRAQLPGVKLIAILRDPVERAFSQYRFNVLLERERRSFPEIVATMLDPAHLAHSRRFPDPTNSYVILGEYGRTLAGYYEVFPAHQLLVLFTADLQRAPHEVLRQIFGFLGVDPHFMPDNVGKRYRQGAMRRRTRLLDASALQAALARRTVPRSLWHALPPAVRWGIDRHFTEVAYRLELWNRRPTQEASAPSEHTRSRLAEHYRADRTRLRDLMGQEPAW